MSITQALHELRRRYGCAPLYGFFWARIATGEIPAQRVEKRWQINPSDLETIAATLKLDRAAG